MMRKLIAVAAVSGSLALGAVGLVGSGTAGASVASTSAAATMPAVSPATHAARCAKAEKVAVRINKLEAKAAAWVPKAEAREAKATAAGHTKLEALIAKRIARVQKLETSGNTLLAKIAAKCGSSTSAS